MGYSPKGCKELDMTELNTHTTYINIYIIHIYIHIYEDIYKS